MKVIRDNKGHICQINYDDGSEIKNEKEAYDFIIADEKEITAREIAREKEITAREKNRCDFWKDSIPNIANSITSAITNQIINDSKTFSIQKTDSRITSTQQEKEKELVDCHAEKKKIGPILERIDNKIADEKEITEREKEFVERHAEKMKIGPILERIAKTADEKEITEREKELVNCHAEEKKRRIHERLDKIAKNSDLFNKEIMDIVHPAEIKD